MVGKTTTVDCKGKLQRANGLLDKSMTNMALEVAKSTRLSR